MLRYTRISPLLRVDHYVMIPAYAQTVHNLTMAELFIHHSRRWKIIKDSGSIIHEKDNK